MRSDVALYTLSRKSRISDWISVFVICTCSLFDFIMFLRWFNHCKLKKIYGKIEECGWVKTRTRVWMVKYRDFNFAKHWVSLTLPKLQKVHSKHYHTVHISINIKIIEKGKNKNLQTIQNKPRQFKTKLCKRKNI